MLKTTSTIGSSIILQSLINMANEDEVGGSENSSNETNLSNPSTSKKSTEASDYTSKSTKKGGNNPKRGGNNTKKYIKATRDSNYLNLNAKKVFNYLRHAFI